MHTAKNTSLKGTYIMHFSNQYSADWLPRQTCTENEEDKIRDI